MLKKSRFYSVGVEADKNAVKVVCLKREFGAISLDKVIKRDLAKNREPSCEQIADIIFETIQDNKIKPDFLGITLSGQMAFVRLIDLPPLNTDKIKQMIKYETQQQIPFSLDSVFWDYCIIDMPQVLHKRKIALVAIKKELIEPLINRLHSKRLNLGVIEITPFSIFNLASFNNDLIPEGLVGIIYAGLESTDFILYKNGDIWLRSFPIGSERLMNASKEKLGLDSIERVATYALEKSEDISNTLESTMESWVSELKHSLDYYYTQEKKIALSRLILNGEWANIPGLDTMVEKYLEIKPSIMDPFKELSSEGKMHIMDKLPFATACAVSLRGLRDLPLQINLIKEKVKKEKITQGKAILKRSLYAAAVLAMAVTLNAAFKGYALNRTQYLDLSKELNEARIFNPKIKLLLQDKENIINRIKLFYKIAKKKNMWLDVLSEITRMMPEEMWLVDFSAKMNLDILAQDTVELSITGKAFSYNDINQFVTNLKTSRFLAEVKPLASSYSEKDITSGRDVLGFTVSMDVNADMLDKYVKVDLVGEE